MIDGSRDVSAERCPARAVGFKAESSNGPSMTAEHLADLQRKHLGKRFFLVLWTNNPDVGREAFMDMLPIHLEFLAQLEERGILFGAGPLRADGESNAAPPNGMAILRAASFSEATSILAEEPFTKNGYRHVPVAGVDPQRRKLFRAAPVRRRYL